MVNNSTQISQKNERLDRWNTDKKILAANEINNIHHISYPKQKEIYWVKFGENIGYEFNKLHPALVISKNLYNKKGTTIVAPISSGKLRRGKNILKCNYILYKNNYPNLSKDCLIKFDQMKCVSNFRLQSKICQLNNSDWEKIILRIKTTFDIN